MSTDEMQAGPFSTAVRTLTGGVHRDAERSRFLDDLVAGTLPLTCYAAMVAQHWHIYAALEQAADAMRDDPVAGAFVHDGLTRLPALEADLDALLGEDWKTRSAPVPATIRYVHRLRDVCRTWSGGFVAHHYTRYLGDLSGGRFIAAAVRKAYGLPGVTGTRFYEFDGIGSPAAFKAQYRDTLDAAAWSPDERRRVLDEVLVAYRLNIDVLHDLALGGTSSRAA
ncbi:biliverdin-producing heme oxygenase [Dactylosporangium sp. NPDC005555]|uniref:biliverdin-producing heme oxygenase n=1 Tax=Dactylosporangium sp. NPDC005555 TaxID=3154889 RepID=UPI0033B10F31